MLSPALLFEYSIISHHPSHFPVRVLPLSDEFEIGGDGKIPFHLTEQILELVALKPDVVAAALHDISFGRGVIGRRTCHLWVAYVLSCFKKADWTERSLPTQ